MKDLEIEVEYKTQTLEELALKLDVKKNTLMPKRTNCIAKYH